MNTVFFPLSRTLESCTASSAESPSPKPRLTKAYNTFVSPVATVPFSSNQQTLASKTQKLDRAAVLMMVSKPAELLSFLSSFMHKLRCQILSCCQLGPFGLTDQNNQESFFLSADILDVLLCCVHFTVCLSQRGVNRFLRCCTDHCSSFFPSSRFT